MTRKRNAPPAMRRHSGKDYYYVRLNHADGHRETIYLGPCGSAAAPAERARLREVARRNYDTTIARYLAGDRQQRNTAAETAPTIGELALRFLDWMEATDRTAKKKKYLSYKSALQPLVDLYAEMAVADFRLKHLALVRERMLAIYGHWKVADPAELQRANNIIKSNVYRASRGQPLLPVPIVQKIWVPAAITTINERVSQIKAVFKKGVAFDLVSEEKVAQIRLLDGLIPGESTAREAKNVLPVPLPDFFATLEMVGPVVRAMLILQITTGMRSNEICCLKKKNLRKKSNGIWEYEPEHHKTEKVRKGKRIPISGDVIAEFRRLIDFDEAGEDEYLFSPRSATVLYRQKRAEESNTAPRHVARKVAPRSAPGDRYTPDSYRQAIQRAAIRAGVPVWHPHQLRHNAATVIDQNFDKEAVMTVLGHLTEKVSDGYIDYNEKKADAVASAIHDLIFRDHLEK